MPMNAREILEKRNLLQLQNCNKKKAIAVKKSESVVTGTYLGVSSAASFNGNRVGMIQTSTGITRSEIIASGRLPDRVTIVKQNKELFGFVPGMPAGR